MTQSMSRCVVITGASTGIGAGCAIGCAQQGMTVFAGVRDLRAGEALQAKGGATIIPLQLDVTDGDSIKQAAEIVEQRVGAARLAGLVNNAGISIGSPLEVIPLAQLRKQLEVNVIGQIAVTQAFLPLLRRALECRLAECHGVARPPDSSLQAHVPGRPTAASRSPPRVSPPAA